MDSEILDLPGESWKDVGGFKGRYEISNLGRVRCLDSHRFMEAILSGESPPKKIRRQHVASNGYLTVSFTWERKVKTFHVHSLVCKTFLGPRPKNFHAGHRNGDQKDNRLENLRWVSAVENAADKVPHGTRKRGAEHPGAILAERDVREIKNKIAAKNRSLRSISRDYSVSPSLISRINNGKVWGWLE